MDWHDLQSEEKILDLSWLMIFVGIVVYCLLKLGINAGYGRYTNTARFGLSPGIAWFIQEAPSFFIPFICIFRSKTNSGLFLNVLFCIHYFNRALIFPFRIRSKTVSPLYIMLSAIFFCCYNGFIQGTWNALYQPEEDYWFFYIIVKFYYNLFERNYIFCSAVFFIGMFINHRADDILLNLRRPGETGYKIPRGFLYEYISCPNYYGEIVEWIGYAIAARSVPAVAFAIFTFCNIGPRAFSHHAWYLEKFPEYPKDRKALIPFVC
uniref:3-oxo-5alpha-steroid 4-dehydrogenase (NADP(+)) n=1 Tax=Caenorhabditis japonica TaxID=281687 RepID=A0A8R1DMJ5_CAEJA